MVNKKFIVDTLLDLKDGVIAAEPKEHTHSKADITDFEHEHAYSDLTGIPETFTPAEHDHTKADITDFEHTHSYTELENIPETFAPSAHASAHGKGGADEVSIDASQITAGVIDIARLPQASLERVVVVADDTARFALTAEQAQKGDTVKVQSTGLMYFVVDDTKLGEAAGYEEYTVGQASAVPWSGVTDKPTEFKPEAHTHEVADVNGLQGVIDNTINPHVANKENPHAVTAEQVGLGNVDNTADTDKPVSTAQAEAIAEAKAEVEGEITALETELVADIADKTAGTILSAVSDTVPASAEEGAKVLVWGANSAETKIYTFTGGAFDAGVVPTSGVMYQNKADGKTYVFTVVTPDTANYMSLSDLYGGDRKEQAMLCPANHFIIGSVSLKKDGAGTGSAKLFTARAGTALTETKSTQSTESVVLPAKINQMWLGVAPGAEDREYTTAGLGFTLA